MRKAWRLLWLILFVVALTAVSTPAFAADDVPLRYPSRQAALLSPPSYLRAFPAPAQALQRSAFALANDFAFDTLSALRQSTNFSAPTSTSQLETGAGAIYIAAAHHLRAEERTYLFPNGDFYFQQQATPTAAASSWQVESSSCEIRYFDPADKQWITKKADQGTLPKALIFLIFEHCQFIISPPYAYCDAEMGCLEVIPEADGQVQVNEVAAGQYQITISWPLSQADQLHWWVLGSTEEMLDWQDPFTLEIWSGYQFNAANGRWCGDGYYVEKPASYIPEGENLYFCNPASYIPVKMILSNSSRAADALGISMIDIVRKKYNAQGFVPLSTGSTLLAEDYEIYAGYYDTRWNTDLAEAYLHAGERFAIPAFQETALRYADFLVLHAERNSFSLPGYDSNALLVSDYANLDGSGLTHASLNHQLAEILFLYHAGEPYYNMANRMLNGLKSAGSAWLMPDHNLQYAITPEGGYWGTDYPFLTYNDLFNLQQWLETYRQRDAYLDQLMAEKLLWMQANQVTGYKQ